MPLRVMVCHWSRMRPVFSRSGRPAVVSVRSAGISGATKRALRSLVKKPPSAKKRCLRLDIASTHSATAPAPAHRTPRPTSTAARRYRNRDRPCSRTPTARHVRGRCPPPNLKSNAAPKPRRLATSLTIHQSGLASPGGVRNARCREMRRSELVTVPDFSPQACAGNSTCAPELTVSLERDVLGDHEQFELFQRGARGIGVRQRHRRIGAHHPQRLDLAARRSPRTSGPLSAPHGSRSAAPSRTGARGRCPAA